MSNYLNWNPSLVKFFEVKLKNLFVLNFHLTLPMKGLNSFGIRKNSALIRVCHSYNVTLDTWPRDMAQGRCHA